jgi:hypothetical protein
MKIQLQITCVTPLFCITYLSSSIQCYRRDIVGAVADPRPKASYINIGGPRVRSRALAGLSISPAGPSSLSLKLIYKFQNRSFYNSRIRVLFYSYIRPHLRLDHLIQKLLQWMFSYPLYIRPHPPPPPLSSCILTQKSGDFWPSL